jgi:K+-sensing histidine kinase KdpD
MKIRRIVVGLEPLPASRAVLEAAAQFADRAEAELVAVFMENVDLLRFAAMPFACEVGLASARRRELDLQRMERSLRALAAEARETLAAVAGGLSVRWSFRVARGAGAVELLAVAEASDLVIASPACLADFARSGRARIVRAGEVEALRNALHAAAEGIVVLAGDDAILLGETLRAVPPAPDARG